MSEYRRNRLPGATYFFTVNLLNRRSDLLVANIEPLREAVRQVRNGRPFHIDAWVVLPDHMHALWTLPEDDSDFPGRWRAIKIAFSKSRRGERGVWQRRYWEHTVRDDRDYAACMDYIHFNPVKHGLREAGRLPFSSFHRAVSVGLYPAEWADDTGLGQTGERR
jgi:putative transposase